MSRQEDRSARRGPGFEALRVALTFLLLLQGVSAFFPGPPRVDPTPSGTRSRDSVVRS